MTNKKLAYQKLGNSIIEKCKPRGIEGYYCNSSKEALELVKSILPEKCIVASGGSVTLEQTGIFDYLKESGLLLYDRTQASMEEREKMYPKEVCSDYYFMGTNAVTFSGELVNIDGNGNRISCLMTGPKNVIVIAGMNKTALNVEDAIHRVKHFAAPPNAVRLDRKTPCVELGRCADCLTDDCICCHTLITRKSRMKNRIKLILIGEELGY